MKVIMRADDLGFCEAVNYGIIKSIKDGLITTVGLMPNMGSSSKHGAELMQSYPRICLGQHTNICLGVPVSDPKLIPSLVDENGEFLSSKVYRNSKEDFINYNEVKLEVEAQLNKFIELTGKKPYYLEGHAIMSKKFFKALEEVAKKHDILYIPIDVSSIRGTYIKQCNFPKVVDGNYDVFNHIKNEIKGVQNNEVLNLIFHPGYVDEFVMTKSTFNLLRCREVDVLCSKALKEYLKLMKVEVISYKNI